MRIIRKFGRFLGAGQGHAVHPNGRGIDPAPEDQGVEGGARAMRLVQADERGRARGRGLGEAGGGEHGRLTHTPRFRRA